MAKGEVDPAETRPGEAVTPEEITEVPPFIITGIGASAGGLEALETFLKNTPPDIGAGFVVVTHMDPEHRSLLPEILQRSTTMPVVRRARHEGPAKLGLRDPQTPTSPSESILNLEEPSDQGMRCLSTTSSRSRSDQDSKAVASSSPAGHDGVLGLRR